MNDNGFLSSFQLAAGYLIVGLGSAYVVGALVTSGKLDRDSAKAAGFALVVGCSLIRSAQHLKRINHLEEENEGLRRLLAKTRSSGQQPDQATTLDQDQPV